MRLSPRVAELAQALTECSPYDGAALTWLLPELRDLLGATFAGAYRPEATESGWAVDFMFGAGPDAEAQISAFRKYVSGLSADRFHGYDPCAVPVALRNVTTSLDDLRRLQGGAVVGSLASVLEAVGARGSDQIRVLLCNGPRLLSWVGATRSEPFTRRELAILRHISEPLRQRVRLEGQLRPGWPRALALDAALAALGRAAFLVGPRGAIEAANEEAERWLEHDAASVSAAIDRSQRAPSDDAPFSVTPLRMRGCPAYLLAIQGEARPTVADRVAAAQRRWGLSPRQARVLELVASGEPTKRVAEQLGCAAVTVENHITELFRRSGSKSRTDLVARLFALGP